MTVQALQAASITQTLDYEVLDFSDAGEAARFPDASDRDFDPSIDIGIGDPLYDDSNS